MSIVTVVRTPRGAERSQDSIGFNYHFNRKSLLGLNPNLWIAMQSLVSQEAETRVLPMNNAAGLVLTVNQGRKQEQKAIAFRLKSIVIRFADLSPEKYLKCLAKHSFIFRTIRNFELLGPLNH